MNHLFSWPALELLSQSFWHLKLRKVITTWPDKVGTYLVVVRYFWVTRSALSDKKVSKNFPTSYKSSVLSRNRTNPRLLEVLEFWNFFLGNLFIITTCTFSFTNHVQHRYYILPNIILNCFKLILIKLFQVQKSNPMLPFFEEIFDSPEKFFSIFWKEIFIRDSLFHFSKRDFKKRFSFLFFE